MRDTATDQPPAISCVQPVYGHIPPACSISMQRLIAINVAKRLFVHVDHRLGTYIDAARCQLVQATLDHPNRPTHILFVDQDMVVPADAPERLAAHGMPIVGGAYFLKGDPFTPVAFDFDLDGIDSIKDFRMIPRLPHRKVGKVGGIGMGCTLIDCHVFRDMEEHYGDKQWFHTSPTMGEDVWFARRCMEMGVPIYLDRTVQCGHVGDVEVSFPQYQFALEARATRGDKTDADVLSERRRSR